MSAQEDMYMYLGGLFCKTWLVVDEFDVAYDKLIIVYASVNID